MSQPLPDDEEWAATGGRESQGSYAFSTQGYSQRMPYSPHWNDIEYIREDSTQLDTSIEDFAPQEKHQRDERAASIGNTNTGASNTQLGNLISRPHFGDPRQEVIDTFSFAHHDLRKSSKQRQPDRNLGSAARIAGGGDQLNTPRGAQRISFPHPKASSPVEARDSPIKKMSPINTRETGPAAPVSSSAPIQDNSSVNIRGQQSFIQKDLHTHQNQEPKGASSPSNLRNDGVGSRDKVIQSTHKNEREPSSQNIHPSDCPQPTNSTQRERRSGSTNTVGSSLAPVEQPVESVERDGSVSTGVPAFISMNGDMGIQSSKDPEDESPVNSTPTRNMAKPRQAVDDKGKSNVGLPIEAKIVSQAPSFQPLEPSRRAQDAASSHEGRRYSAVTTIEGPRDTVFSPGHRQTLRPRHTSTDRGFRQAPRARLGRRYPATPGINRPMRKEPVQQPPCRPLSSDSNVSKRRAPQPKSSPANHSEKLDNQFEKLTHFWNTYFTSLGVFRTETEANLTALKKRIKTQEEDIEEYREHAHAQDQLVDQATAERDQWAAQAEKERQRADSCSSKVQKLETKCQEFKTQLNAATQEHQHLYRRNRELILTAQKEQEARLEHIRQENEKIRTNIQSSVAKVSKEAQDQISKLNEETSILRVQLNERQKEVSNEKGIAEGLRKEHDRAQLLLTQNIQTLESQNDRILKTLSQSTKSEVDAHLINEQTERLDTILKSIEDVRVSNHAVITDLIQSLKNDFVKEISGAIREEMTSKQPLTKEDTEVLTTGIGSIQEVCDYIYNQVRDDEDSQRVHYMYQESQHRVQLLDERLRDTIEQWQQVASWNLEFGQANEELQAKLKALEEENKELQATADATQTLNDENCSLMKQIEHQEELISANSDLEEQVATLKATVLNLQTDVDLHQHLEDEMARLEDRIKEKDQTIKKAGKVSKHLEENLEKAVQQSKGLEQRLQDDRQELHERLESTEKERSRLEDDLAAARERIQELSSVRSAEETEMRSLREKMEEQNAITKEVGKEVQATQQIHEQVLVSFAEFSKEYKEMERIKKELLQESERLRMNYASANLANLMDERTRRVVVQSPRVPDVENYPPSVEQEREARRQAITPKSIMRVTHATARDVEASRDNNSAPEAPDGTNNLNAMPEKPLGSNHSMYNRPVHGASNGQITQWFGSQKRTRSRSISNETGKEDEMEHGNKRARPVAVIESTVELSQSTRPKISQSMAGGLQESEDEVTEKDMSTRTFGNSRSSSQSQRGGPLPRRTSSLTTYGRGDPEPHNASQASIASSQTISQGSLGGQPSSQSQDQQRKLPFKRRPA